MRFFSPLLFLAAAGGVYAYNSQQLNQALVLPFMDLIDASSVGNPARQGQLTVQVLIGVALVLGVRDVYGWWREKGGVNL